MDTRTQTQTHNDDGVATLAVLHRKLKGGYVKRYHTRPELADHQDVAAHSWRATVLLHTLWPDASKECLLHMLYHDVPEGELGDLPATTKWRHPILADCMATLEQAVEQELGISIPLSEEEAGICDTCDKLELMLHCHRLYKMGNTFALDVFERGGNYLTKYHAEPWFAPALQLIGMLDED